jgi:DNA-binding NtrC family response regulator
LGGKLSLEDGTPSAVAPIHIAEPVPGVHRPELAGSNTRSFAMPDEFAPMEILLVEDEADFRETAAQWLARKGHMVCEAGNGSEGLRQTELRHFDVVVCDMNMPGMTGLQFLERLRTTDSEAEVIILTGQATVENAVEAMKLGAIDYLTKPFPLAELERRCRRACERAKLLRENRNLKTLLQREQRPLKLIGESPAMLGVFRLIERVGPSNKAVLIQGESGTGKELVARGLQAASNRADKPFVTINCAALPESLVESELFGHEKGSFTGAHANKPGLFEVADGGTLFIDEIGELPLALQPKLLRVLEDGSLRRVGSHQERKVDVRIIAATNRNMEQEVQAGRFREDLYYRINVFSLVLPPLRDRGGDVPLLIQKILGPEWNIEPEAMKAMTEYRWPGNIRQLLNSLERAKVLADDQTIGLDDLPAEIANGSPAPVPGGVSASVQAAIPAAQNAIPFSDDTLESRERQHVIDILKRERGNKAKAARVLGIHRRKLYRMIDRLKINLNGDQPAN